MLSLGKIIYSFKHQKEKNSISLPDLDELTEILETVDQEVPEPSQELIPEKVQGKEDFIEKAKSLASYARFDVEIRETEECVTVTYEFETAFLSPGIHRLFVEVLALCDDSLVFPPVPDSNKIMINLFYRLTE